MHTHTTSCWFCFSEEPWLTYSLSSEEPDFCAPSLPPCLLQVFCRSHFFLPTPLHLCLAAHPALIWGHSWPHTQACSLLPLRSQPPQEGRSHSQEWLEGYNRIEANPQGTGAEPRVSSSGTWAMMCPCPSKGNQRTSLNHLLISLAKPFLPIITRVYGIVF